MRFDDDAGLDASEVQDMRGSGGGGGGIGGRVALGGGGLGVVGLIIYFVISQLGGISPGAVNLGSGGGLGSVGSGQQVDNSQLASTCKTGADANKNHDCAIVAIVNSVQDYWAQQFARSGSTYRKAPTNFFNGGVRTGCGSATSDTGPFYCPADSKVYIDLSFFNELKTRFGAQGGQFTEAYVLAHEYGHHVQNLLGTSKKGTGTGPTSGSVRLELQADCYAGVWGNHATTTPTDTGKPLILDITQDDIASALDTASRIGDDYIQTKLGGGQVDSSQFTHGTSAQRKKWFTTGFQTGDPARCDTFGASNLG
ncbi:MULTISPECIES: KPN_02809 family neutral zinc metallopeptidase [unclassified Amycolatopsis]|uniref:KPN_02809 family neutral zinc metallopeptidase n=1 Tax=unclassified Amycolatopsis TaxID=2618356 RepID=UPI002E14CFA7|nr:MULTISPECIES: neutral zinc metallopeptidase [unclassified Amycolatopsis]WSJ75509.1 neutral zinc metallopeptidase [Amycolatopsis sp. NBC_01307]WSK80833.1 neutral zinc metallopeptidase [Amycolatopsis sp. NBC_01286]